MFNDQIKNHNVEQGIASYVDYLNNIRLTDLMNTIDSILTSETEKLSVLSSKSADALSHLNLAKSEINNLINSDRGGVTGIHGFIAEFTERGVRNSRDVFQGLQKSVVLLNDNSPVDILLEGKEVQMKFYSDTLKAIKAASRYDQMAVMIPKDQMEAIDRIMQGAGKVEYNGDSLSNIKASNIENAIKHESSLRGESYEKWLKPSKLKYGEVQKGRIDQTLSDEFENVNKQTAKYKKEIEKEVDENKLNAHQKAQPSFQEASKAALIGTALQGSLNLGFFVYQKRKEGKELWDFDAEDWKQCGIKTAEGSIKGGISGYAIYGLTNVCNLAAPSAGAITSGTFGLTNTIVKYRKGSIDTDGFIDLVTLNAIDATGAAIGAAIGQGIIPIPVVGALVGSIVATSALSLGKGILNKHEIDTINSYEEKITSYVNNLDRDYQIRLEELLDTYHHLGELQDYSFDLNINVQLKFASSIDLATLVGVKNNEILKNESEIDKYFMC